MFASANVRPSCEELAVDLIHGIGHGETGQEVAFFQEHRHFIGIHYVENLKDHNCLVLGEKLEIEALRRS